jgi:hypothetical protein
MQIIHTKSAIIFLHEEKRELSQTSINFFLRTKEDLLAIVRNQEKELKEKMAVDGREYLFVEVGEMTFFWEIKEEKVSVPVSESSTSNPF